MLRRHVLLVPMLAALACATSAPAPRLDPTALTPDTGETVVLDQLVLLFDSSASLPEGSLYRDQMALAEDFAQAMPEGDYEVGAIGFGGFRRTTEELAPFDRNRAVATVTSIPHLAEGTPIHKAIAEASAGLAGKSGRAAVVLYSDGHLTDEVGRNLDSQLAYDAAAELGSGYDGDVCLHTVQTGDDPAGAAFLRELSSAASCGSFRQANSITSVAALHGFERDVFLGHEVLPRVAAAPRDLDGDGVIDPDDLCPGTPNGADVDPRGCWVVKGLYFATDSSAIDKEDERALERVAQVLRTNPELRVQIEGHTDSTGTEPYNQGLSERRAEAARKFLISSGIAESRLVSRGFGESKPAANNGTKDGRRSNRRTEITVIR